MVTESFIFGSKDKTVEWYAKTPPKLQPGARELLEKYAGIPADQVDDHVLAMRDKAWEIHAYPCIGQFRFLDLAMMNLPAYPRVLAKLRDEGGSLLDVGCCVAQDLRRLVFDGAPSTALHGAELEADFIDVGYELFRDRATLQAQFVHADILDVDPDAPLNRMVSAVDIVHFGMILHLFDWDDQLRALERCVRILRPVPGALLLGQAIGHVEGVRAIVEGGRFCFKHSVVTFTKLVTELEQRTGAKFEVRAGLDRGLGLSDSNRKWGTPLGLARRLYFEVERVA